MLELKNLTKSFGRCGCRASEVSLSVPDGAFLVLLGPSGCGKTTLLRMLAGLELPTSGQIVFDGQTVSDGDRQWQVDPAKRNSGLVFQSYALWPHMTVRGNVDWPLKVAGMDAAARTQRVDEVLAMLEINQLAERYPNEISGGQQQRVAIARTIAPKPGVLLFDEPLSNLDAKLRVEMRTELMRLHRATGATAVYVTHDQIEAMTMATHVAVVNKGADRAVRRAAGPDRPSRQRLCRHFCRHPAEQHRAGGQRTARAGTVGGRAHGYDPADGGLSGHVPRRQPVGCVDRRPPHPADGAGRGVNHRGPHHGNGAGRRVAADGCAGPATRRAGG